MKLRVTILALFAYATCFAQGSQATYSSVKSKADSIVRNFTGDEVFERYIVLDSTRSLYLNKMENKKTTFRYLPKFKPDHLRFYYNFDHPRLGKSFPIVFTLDLGHKLIPDDQTYGLINIIDFIDSAVVTKRQAFEMCRDEAVSLQRKSMKLTWYNQSVDFERFGQTGDLTSIWCGRIVWAVSGKINFRGEIYSGTFYVDAITGQMTRAFAVPWD
jgi:hypothetical protein